MAEPKSKKDERAARIRKIVDEFLRRRAGGENVAEPEIFAAQPDLMPELAEDLRKRVRIEQARQAAQVSDPCSTASSDRTMPDGATGPRSIPNSFERPDRIGCYRILDVLGEGGFGVVYDAEQTEPVKRRVALKVIKPGMDSKAVIARFEAERQALAMMDHPCVAKVFDAGTTDQGRPFFVMERVTGVPITEHCDTQRLGVKERLELFIRVCEAVQHAHQKGIIHRDIKPSNILVEYKDDRPTPKVIDFGVAKAISRSLTEKTVFTQQGQLIGTPEYMSPEQAEMTAQDIDTRSDIYSLGVLLYELLTGTLPFDRQALRSAGFAAIQRIIREVEPPKPSMRLSGMTADDRVDEPRAPATGQSLVCAWGSSAHDVAHRRQTDPKTLLKQVRGDLDWIVMKALEKDRSRRYETANGLVADIERYLTCQPVLASPPSAAYQMRKFVWRHRGGVLAGGLVTLALLAGLIGTATFAVREASQRRLAQDSEQCARDAAEQAQAARKAAEEQRRLAEQREARARDYYTLLRFQSSGEALGVPGTAVQRALLASLLSVVLSAMETLEHETGMQTNQFAAWALARAAWYLVLEPKRDPEVYQLGLWLAKAATMADVDPAESRASLGAALYRSGLHADALEQFAKCPSALATEILPADSGNASNQVSPAASP